MSQSVELVLIAGAAVLVPVVVLALLVKSWWRSVPQGQALIVNRMQGEPRVSFTGALVLPIVHRAETIDLAVRQVEIHRRGKEGVICRDNIRADMKVGFFIRIQPTTNDILEVARSLGAARASDQATLDSLFGAKFAEAIKTVAKGLEFEELYTERAHFKDQIVAIIGTDLNGFRLDDVVIDSLEQTPLEVLDPHNILDAQGIKKILSHAGDLDRLYRLRRQRQQRDAASPPEPIEPLQAELERLGLLDVRVITEVSCDVAVECADLSVQLDDDTDAPLAQLPRGVPRSLIAAVGRGALIREAGRATFRWNQADVTLEQLIAGARLVRALREDPRAYR